MGNSRPLDYAPARRRSALSEVVRVTALFAIAVGGGIGVYLGGGLVFMFLLWIAGPLASGMVMRRLHSSVAIIFNLLVLATAMLLTITNGEMPPEPERTRVMLPLAAVSALGVGAAQLARLTAGVMRSCQEE